MMNTIKKVLLGILAIGLLLSFNGCRYYNHKWDDLSQSQKQEAKEVIQEVKNDISNDFSDHNVDTIEDKLALFIVERIEERINKAD